MSNKEIETYLARTDRPTKCAHHPDRPRFGVMFTGPEPITLCLECMQEAMKHVNAKGNA